LAFFHSPCSELKYKFSKSGAINQRQTKPWNWQGGSMKIKVRCVVVGTIHSVNFGLFAKIRFHWTSLRSCLAPGLDQKLISPGVSWNTYIYRNGDKRTHGRFTGRVKIEGVRNMKYEGRDDGRSKFVRLLSFCSGRWKGRTSTGSFVNCPVEPWRLDKGETDYAGY